MTARILSPSLENIETAVEALKSGDVVGLPTETVYGLAGDGTSPLALSKIFETKERPTFDPLILHVGPLARGLKELERLKIVDGSKLSELARNRVDLLIQRFWPGALTLILPKHETIPDLATSGLPTVAVRMPRHPIAQAVISSAQVPLAAPSANRFGRISPTTAQAVFEELGDRIEWILDGGPCQIGVESTIVGVWETGEVELLRYGGISPEEIESVCGKLITRETEENTETLRAPGMLASHYAPRKPMALLPRRVEDLSKEDLSFIFNKLAKTLPSAESRLGLLVFSGDTQLPCDFFSQKLGRPVLARVLSPSGDMREAAHALFQEMRTLDTSGVEMIFAEPCPTPLGLGYAITDRLNRASTPFFAKL